MDPSDGGNKHAIVIGTTNIERSDWQARCTIKGTRRDNTLVGTAGDDVISDWVGTT